MVHLVQTVHLSCIGTNCLQTERNENRHDPCQLAVPLGASKIIFEPVVRLAETVHLSSTKITTISKRTQRSFQLSLITKEYHRVRPQWFQSLWYVWGKPCTCIALTITVSPNRPKRDSTWPTSPRSSMGCIQNDFWALWYIQREPCTYLASRLALSPNGPKQASTWASSPRSTIGCIQNDF
jgi:hypothetical protein